MHAGIDPKKDQSYFLFTTTQEQLDYLRFPLGGVNKATTRQIAEHFGLEIADKADSQDICFVPNGSYSSVIEKLRPGALDSGDIVFKDGTIIGKHDGIINYTIGQRKGLGIARKDPLYVIKLDPEKKQVVVGYKEDLGSSDLIIKELNWLGGEQYPQDNLKCKVKLRSLHTPKSATIKYIGDNKAIVYLDEPYDGITPGQACVLYDGTRVLGGGWIERR